MNSRPSQVTESHLHRRAIVYIRQSTPEQVKHATGSTALQRDLVSVLNNWGWPLDSIDVIDGDLGVSGSHAGLREGFSELLSRIENGDVGVVAVTDISRLGRNLPDLFALALAVRRHGVLILHGSQIADFTDPNSEFTGLLFGMNAARENRLRAEHSRRARRKKAEAGVASTAAPAGYIAERGGTWHKDPDESVREVIQLIFDKYEELGSCGAVSRYLEEHKIKIPRPRRRTGLAWGRPSRVRIHRILRNPAYAGVYVYGATQSQDGRQSSVPRGERLYCEGHHEAYLPRARWAEIQNRLNSNRRVLRAPLGRGDALIQGILRCTIHNRRFSTFYPIRERRNGTLIRRAVYRCFDLDGGSSNKQFCAAVRASTLDQVVEREIFRVLKPPSLDVLREVHREGQREYEALVRFRESKERQAQQAAAEAERAHSQASTTHTLVRQRLSEQWEEALQRLKELQTDYRLHPLTPPADLSEAEQRELHELLADLPSLWRHPHVTPEIRKGVTRAAISEIHVRPEPQSWAVDIEWVGGERTKFVLLTSKGVRALVERAVSDGRTSSDIAQMLADQGAIQRSGPHIGKPYTTQTVKLITRRFGWDKSVKRKAYEYLRARYIDGISLRQIADELNARRLSHSQGAWTEHRAQGAIFRLRLHDVAGVPALPTLESPVERILSLHREGRSGVEIAAELRRTGAVTIQRRPFSPDTVRQIIRRQRRATSARNRTFRRRRTSGRPSNRE